MSLSRRESIIQQEIVNYLSTISARYDFLFFSVPNESFLIGGPDHSRKQFGTLATLKKMGMRKGAADLVIGHAGHMFCLAVILAVLLCLCCDWAEIFYPIG